MIKRKKRRIQDVQLHVCTFCSHSPSTHSFFCPMWHPGNLVSLEGTIQAYRHICLSNLARVYKIADTDERLKREHFVFHPTCVRSRHRKSLLHVSPAKHHFLLDNCNIIISCALSSCIPVSRLLCSSMFLLALPSFL